MKSFELLFAQQAVEFIEQQNRRERGEIKLALAQLKEFSHKCRDLVEQHSSGREHFVFLRGEYAIKFWIDEWEREVKVLHLQLRNR
jgi:hypothetical protein